MLDHCFWRVPANRASELRQPSNWTRLSHLSLVPAVVGNLDSAMFALSTHFIDVAAAAVLFETWPIFYILLTSRLLPGDGPTNGLPRPVNWCGTSALLSIAFTGMVLVFASQHPDRRLLDFVMEFPSGAADPDLYGLAAILFAALLGSFPFFSLRYGLDLSRQIGDVSDAGPSHPGRSMSAFHLQPRCITMVTMLANVASMPVSAAIAAVTAEGLPTHPDLGHNVIWMAITCRSITYALPTIGWRVANLMSRNPGINAMAFMTPAASVALLVVLLWDVQVAHWGLFAMGAGAV